MTWIAFLALGLVPSCVAVLYLLFLAIARQCGVHDASPDSVTAATRFLLLIPAHDEASGLGTTLASCAALDYPRDRFRTLVLADNCRDATADVAREAGAACLERHDPARPGKGHALAWALERLRNDELRLWNERSFGDWDAILVLDADCLLEPHALSAADAFVQRGDRALQLNHRVLNPDESVASYAAAVGRCLEYDLFYAPKSRLGGVVLLVGTGMVLHRELLDAIPWQATSSAEDTEYSLQLARRDVPVRFISDAHVGVTAPASLAALDIQRRRWARGNLGLGRQHALACVARGLLHGRWREVDLGVTLLLQSRPLWLAHLAFVVLAAAVLVRQGSAPAWLPTVVAVLVALHGVYLLLGMLRVGFTARRLQLLAASPLLVARLAWIALRALPATAASSWTRTPR